MDISFVLPEVLAVSRFYIGTNIWDRSAVFTDAVSEKCKSWVVGSDQVKIQQKWKVFVGVHKAQNVACCVGTNSSNSDHISAWYRLLLRDYGLSRGDAVYSGAYFTRVFLGIHFKTATHVQIPQVWVQTTLFARHWSESSHFGHSLLRCHVILLSDSRSLLH